jgi:hypothetical protein
MSGWSKKRWKENVKLYQDQIVVHQFSPSRAQGWGGLFLIPRGKALGTVFLCVYHLHLALGLSPAHIKANTVKTPSPMMLYFTKY